LRKDISIRNKKGNKGDENKQ